MRIEGQPSDAGKNENVRLRCAGEFVKKKKMYLMPFRADDVLEYDAHDKVQKVNWFVLN